MFVWQSKKERNQQASSLKKKEYSKNDRKRQSNYTTSPDDAFPLNSDGSNTESGAC